MFQSSLFLDKKSTTGREEGLIGCMVCTYVLMVETIQGRMLGGMKELL